MIIILSPFHIPLKEMVCQKHIIFLCSTTTYRKTQKVILHRRQVFIFSFLCQPTAESHCRGTQALWLSLLVSFWATRPRLGKSSPGLVLRFVWSLESLLVFVILWCDCTQSGSCHLICRCQLCCYCAHAFWSRVLVSLRTPWTSSSCSVFVNNKIRPLWEDVGQLEPGLAVTWNTGSEHKQGHCSLKKKLGRSNVDLLLWLRTGTWNPIIVHSVEKGEKVPLFCFNPTEVNERIRTRLSVSLSFKIFLWMVSRWKTSFGDWRMLSFVEQLIKVSYNLNDLLWCYIAKQKILFLQDRSTLTWYMVCVRHPLHSDMEAQCANGPLSSWLSLFFYKGMRVFA